MAKLDQMQPQLLVPAAASPDRAAAAGLGRAVMEGPCDCLEILVAKSLCRAVTGVPAEAFYKWMPLHGGSDWSFQNERSGALGVRGFARDTSNSKRRASGGFKNGWQLKLAGKIT